MFTFKVTKGQQVKTTQQLLERAHLTVATENALINWYSLNYKIEEGWELNTNTKIYHQNTHSEN